MLPYKPLYAFGSSSCTLSSTFGSSILKPSIRSHLPVAVEVPTNEDSEPLDEQADDPPDDINLDDPNSELPSPKEATALQKRYFITDAFGNRSSVRLAPRDIKYIKQHRHRDRYLKQHFGLSWDSPDVLDHVKMLCFYSVDVNTFEGYSSHWTSLRRASLPFTYESVYVYMVNHRKEYANKTLDHWFSAIKLYRAAMGLLPDEERKRYFANGYARDNPDGITKKRGAITLPRLRELCAHSRIRNTLYATAYQTQYACGLRSDQMSSIHFTQFHPVHDNKNKDRIINYVYICPKHKYKSAHLKNATEHHICDPTFVDFLTEQIGLARLTSHGFLHPSWNPTEALELIKTSAPELQWDENLKWVNHSIRHGSAVDAASSSQDSSVSGQLVAAQQRTCQSSFQVVGHYCESNEQRSEIAEATRAMVEGGFNRLTVNDVTYSRSRFCVRASKAAVASTVGGRSNKRALSLAAKARELNTKRKALLGASNLEHSMKMARQAAARHSASQRRKLLAERKLSASNANKKAKCATRKKTSGKKF